MSRRIGRREFIAAAAGAIAGLKARTVLAQGAQSVSLDRFGVSLYTLRDMMKVSVPKTLAAVAAAGYREVEFTGYFNTPVRVMRKLLDDHGLTSPSSHVTMSDIGMMLPKTLDEANILGQKYVTVAWIDGPERTAQGYRRIADRFNAAGLQARGDGLQIAYYNHAYEFIPLGGKTGYEILLSECDPRNLSMDVDIFWMRRAKQDPLAWFAKYPGRFHMLHLTDMGPPPKNEMRDVGKGTMDWRRILSHSKAAGVRHFLVEQDESKNPLASTRSSINYLRGLRF